MLTGLKVYSPRTSAPVLPIGIGDANTDRVQIRGIEGLGPVKANINTTQFGSFDGELYSGSSVGKRNIVLTLGLNPDWATQSMADLRNTLYAYFMPKLWVRLRFTSDHMPDVQIDGYIESFEPNMFSKDPEIQISIICPKPNFVAVTSTTVTGTVEVDPATGVTINYAGTVATGGILTISSSAGTPSYTGYIRVRNFGLAEEKFSITPVTIDTTPKQFVLNTRQGSKSVRLMSGNTVVSNLLTSVTGIMAWPTLKPGLNNFSVVGSSAGQTWSLVYYAQYGGL
ncbi:MAG TPA: phage tail family protein [Nitrospira sp.]|nr:phage tail family protein [Nitrospira sp.]